MSFENEDVLKYCDGTLSEELSSRLREACNHDTDLAARVQAMEASKLPYQAAFTQQLQPPVPQSLRIDVAKLVRSSQSTDSPDTSTGATTNTERSGWLGFSTKQLTGIAASVALCSAVGYGIGKQQSDTSMSTLAQQVDDVQSEWVNSVAEYQSLYVQETVAGIKNGAETATSLLANLETSTELRTAIPDLSSLGYAFVRAQQLGYKGDPLVQLIYSKPDTAPLALCYMPSRELSTQALEIGEYKHLKTADWIQNGQRYVLVGDESTDVMEKLYTSSSQAWL